MIKKEFLKNAVAVSAVSLTMNVIGIVFRTYLSNRVGAETMGLLQLVLSVYFPACTLASSGVYVASTRLCSEALARRDRSVTQILNRCLLYSLVFGGGSFLLLFFGAKTVAGVWLGFPKGEIPLKILSLSLPFLAASNALQGFFLSLRKATYSTVLQVSEDLSKIGATVLLFCLYLDRGPTAALCATVAGMAVGETVSFLIGYTLYRRKIPGLPLANPRQKTTCADVIKIALPCAFSAYLRSGLGMIENLLVPRGLTAYGLTEEQTLSALGKIDGMALPVLVFPAAFLAVVSKLLVPEIAAENAVGNKESNVKTSNEVLRWTLLYSIFIGLFMAVFGPDLGMVLYHDEACGRYIRILSPIIPVLYCDRVTDGIMKGYNEQLTTMRINILETVFQTLGALFLIPITGIVGYVALFCVGSTFNFALSYRALKKIGAASFPPKRELFSCLLAAGAAILPFKTVGTVIRIPLWVSVVGAAGFYLVFLREMTGKRKKTVKIHLWRDPKRKDPARIPTSAQRKEQAALRHLPPQHPKRTGEPAEKSRKNGRVRFFPDPTPGDRPRRKADDAEKTGLRREVSRKIRP
ncbi:MAG: oligosaccharide flippase family protein [Clostridia bacterium]|nr:oligosaccharide flippase family protein [Clostridia bacterium]